MNPSTASGSLPAVLSGAKLTADRPEKLQALVKHLTTDYDWRANEKRFNDMGEQAHLAVSAGGEELKIHYVHKGSSDPAAIPLLLCHGWPGQQSIAEHFNQLRLVQAASGSSKALFLCSRRQKRARHSTL